MSAQGLRRYALAMALLNVLAALVLSAMLMVNIAYGSPNWIVATLGSLATAVFTIIAMMWSIQAIVTREPAKQTLLKGAHQRA